MAATMNFHCLSLKDSQVFAGGSRKGCRVNFGEHGQQSPTPQTWDCESCGHFLPGSERTPGAPSSDSPCSYAGFCWNYAESGLNSEPQKWLTVPLRRGFSRVLSPTLRGGTLGRAPSAASC
jgi:hypothetical protein